MSDAKDKMFLMLCCPGRFFYLILVTHCLFSKTCCTGTTGCSDIFPWYECWYFSGHTVQHYYYAFLVLGTMGWYLLKLAYAYMIRWWPSYDDLMIVIWRWVDEHRLPGLFAFRKWFSCPKSSNNGEKIRWRTDYKGKWKVESSILYWVESAMKKQPQLVQ